MSAFRWTPKRDAELLALTRHRFTYVEIATMLGHGCTRDDVRRRTRDMAGEGPKPPSKPDVAAVPRPVAPAPRRGLIDLRTAPSAMEEAAKRWAVEK